MLIYLFISVYRYIGTSKNVKQILNYCILYLSSMNSNNKIRINENYILKCGYNSHWEYRVAQLLEKDNISVNGCGYDTETNTLWIPRLDTDIFDYIYTRQKRITKIEFHDFIFQHILKMHTFGIIHCDIKLENIVLEKDTMKLFLIDFELSMFHGNIDTIRGTKGYILPGEISTKNIQGKYIKDIYAFLVTISALLNIPDLSQFFDTNDEAFKMYGMKILQYYNKIYDSKDNDLMKTFIDCFTNTRHNDWEDIHHVCRENLLSAANALI